MLRAKQKGALEPWGVRNYSHIRYYFHNELRSQFIHFHYANLLHIMYQGRVLRLKPHFCRCYMNQSWDSPCSCRLQCSVTVTWNQRIKDMYNGEKVQIDVSSKKSTFFRAGKNLAFQEKNSTAWKCTWTMQTSHLYLKVDVVLMKWDREIAQEISVLSIQRTNVSGGHAPPVTRQA